MKNILVLIHDDGGQEARLQAALDAARALEGHLTCAHVIELAPVVGDAFGMSGSVMMLEIGRETEAENRARVERRLASEDVPFDWVEITANLEAGIDEAADLADLIVVNSQLPTIFQPRVGKLAERLATRAGRPILAVPNAEGFRPADPVMIAWDGSDPASAAVRAAVPLLSLSRSVTICEIDDGSVESPAEAPAAYLSRHGIKAEVLREKVPDGDFVEPILLSKVESGRFSWAVMGAFSHSRFREALLGGVTRRLLKESPIPLLIAH